jgi:hypothetical protein
MAEKPISGNDIVLQIDPSGGTGYYLLVCLTSNSLTRTTTVIDAASKCGPYKLAGVQNIQVPFTFYDIINTINGEISEKALHPLWANKTVVGWKYGKATPVAGDVSYVGTGFIGTLNTTAAQNAVVTTSSDIEVQGAITQVITGS